MSNIPSLALIVPYSAHDFARGCEAGERWPTLARIAGRGAVTCLAAPPDLAAWRAALLQALGLHATSASYPEAAVMAAATSERGGYWLRATLLHLAAGLNDLRALALEGELQISEAERAQLAATLAPHLRAAGFELETTLHGAWLLRSPRALAVATAAPGAAQRDLTTAMPAGADAAVVKRLMIELQMLLHEHPANLLRERAGLPQINAVWLHGGGALGPVERRELPPAFGVDPYLRGVYRLQGQCVRPPLADAQELLQRISSSTLAVLEAASLDELETRWLTPLIAAMRRGAIGSLELVLDRWRLTLDRSALLKFWRGARSPAHWPT